MSQIIEHHVSHHFDTAKQEFESAKMGMWLFVAQEILFFSGLFVAYFVFRAKFPEAFIEGSQTLNVVLGGVNTVVLIFSSFTMVLALRAAQLSDKKMTGIFLLATIFFACLFLFIKYFEYSSKISHNVIPANLLADGTTIPGKSEALPVFIGIYYSMTGLHALHILIGIGLIFWLYLKNRRGYFHSEYFTPIELVGFYWHIVDIIWIFLFPLLYLI